MPKMVSGTLRITPKQVSSHPVAVMRLKMPLTNCEMAMGDGGHSPLIGMDVLWELLARWAGCRVRASRDRWLKLQTLRIRSLDYQTHAQVR